MPRHVAFLRGINLGKRRVKMNALRSHFVDFGLEGVETFIASGNVVFDHPGPGDRKLEEAIERHLEATLGYEVETFIRPMSRLADLCAPGAAFLAEGDGFTPHVIFLKHPPDAEVEAGLKALESAEDRFRFLGSEIIWLRRGRLSDSPIAVRDLDKALRRIGVTMRNLNTVRRIVERFGAET